MSLLLAAIAALAGPAPTQAADPCPRFGRLHRYDDDVRCLAGQAATAKYLPAGGAAYVSLGGELRERWEYVDAPGLGLSGAPSHDVLLHRLLVHADAVFGPAARAFVQLGNHLQTGRPGAPGPTDRNTADVQQAFADLCAGAWTLRAGRQEIAYGSQRLVTVREGPNVRQSFDAVRLIWAEGNRRVDAFWSRPVFLRPEAFDDRSNPDQAFWGVYGAFGGLDLYYLGLDRRRARFDAGVARERRHSIGTRLAGAAEGWDWDIEAVAQWGRFGQQDIRAWTVASIVGRKMQGPWAPRLWLSMNIASGDRNRSDGRLGTFNPLFPRAPYFSEAAINAPANFFDVHPGVDLAPREDLKLTFAVDLLWRASTGDAFYAQPLAPLITSAASRGRYVGAQLEAKGTWTISRNVSATAAVVHFAAGNFVKAAGGRSQDYVAVWTTLRY